MFTGFNLKIDKDDESFFNSYFDDGQKLLASQKEAIQTSLESYICNNDILDGTKIQENWFHSVNADIFLSHSHKDEHLVVALAGWLKQNCHINAFVDSYIWGYANNLLKILDKRYCVQSQDGDHVTYDYDKRNNSTSHVHMMLSTALGKMIDNSECLFFVNTPSSISISESINPGCTLSPWIYSEIALSQIIRQRIPLRQQKQLRHFAADSVTESADLKIKYDIHLDHLKQLTRSDLTQWSSSVDPSLKHPLDTLYDQVLKGEHLYGRP